MQEQNNRSEVARLIDQIRAAFEAANTGMYGFAAGTARHKFIASKTDRAGELGTRLEQYVGHDAAWQIVGDIYSEVGNAP